MGVIFSATWDIHCILNEVIDVIFSICPSKNELVWNGTCAPCGEAGDSASEPSHGRFRLGVGLFK
jgi:hypothetical protein